MLLVEEFFDRAREVFDHEIGQVVLLLQDEFDPCNVVDKRVRHWQMLVELVHECFEAWLLHDRGEDESSDVVLDVFLDRSYEF